MNLKICVLCVLLLFAVNSVRGQQPPSDALAESLFPPEMLVQFQAEIGITEEQRDSIVAVLQKTKTRFEQMQQQFDQRRKRLELFLN